MTDNLPSDTSIVDIGGVPPVQDDTQVSQPLSPEQPIYTPPASVEIPVPQEQLKTISPEVSEALPLPEASVQAPGVVEEKKAAKQPQTVAAQPPTPVAHVVDKRSAGVEKETHLETTHKLTADADEEEGDFIKHVEEEHLSK